MLLQKIFQKHDYFVCMFSYFCFKLQERKNLLIKSEVLFFTYHAEFFVHSPAILGSLFFSESLWFFIYLFIFLDLTLWPEETWPELPLFSLFSNNSLFLSCHIYYFFLWGVPERCMWFFFSSLVNEKVKQKECGQ